MGGFPHATLENCTPHAWGLLWSPMHQSFDEISSIPPTIDKKIDTIPQGQNFNTHHQFWVVSTCASKKCDVSCLNVIAKNRKIIISFLVRRRLGPRQRALRPWHEPWGPRVPPPVLYDGRGDRAGRLPRLRHPAASGGVPPGPALPHDSGGGDRAAQVRPAAHSSAVQPGRVGARDRTN